MACEGCRRRREAIRKAAETFANGVKAVLHRNNTPEQTSKNVLPCAGCLSRVTAKGWVNVCRLCNAQSDPTPSPSSNPPKCDPSCPRNKND